MVEFLNQHGLSVTDSHTVRKQLQKPLGHFKPKKIKGATILSNAAMTALQKEFHAKHQVPRPYCTLSRPIFLSKNRIWVKIEFFCGSSCGGGSAYIFERKGDVYQFVDAAFLWIS